MTLQISVKTSVADLDGRWDTLAAGRPFTSRRWLAWYERVFEADQVLYLLVEQGDGLVGAAVFWLRRRPTLPDVPQMVETALGLVFRRRPLLICEIPVVGRAGLLLPADPVSAADVHRAILNRAAELADRHRASLVVFGYLDQALNTSPAWPDHYHEVQLFPGTAMDLAETADYGQYLGRLNKKKRKNIRRNRQAALAEGVEVVPRRTIDPDLAVGLADNVARRHGGTLQKEIRRIFAFSDMVDPVWLTAFRDGKVIGFDLLLGDEKVWKVQSTGSDYSSDRLYFLLSDEEIRFAISQKAACLIAGTHLYRVKERLGYEIQPDGYVRYAGMSGIGRLASVAAKLRRKPS